MNLLSNKVWHLFLSRIDGEITRESLRTFGHKWRRERTRAEPKSIGLKDWARKKTVVREGKR